MAITVPPIRRRMGYKEPEGIPPSYPRAYFSARNGRLGSWVLISCKYAGNFRALQSLNDVVR